jgi:ankyrin repeat protein
MAQGIYHRYMEDDSRYRLPFSTFCCFITFQKLLSREWNLFEMAIHEIKGEVRKSKPKKEKKRGKTFIFTTKPKEEKKEYNSLHLNPTSVSGLTNSHQSLSNYPSLIMEDPLERLSIQTNSIHEGGGGGSIRVESDQISPMESILSSVIKEGDLNKFKEIIQEFNMDIHKKIGKTTCLHLSCYFNQLKIVEYLISTVNVQVDMLDSTQRTSLHIASNYGHRDICVFLLSSGAKINTRDNYGYTPLLLSLLKHHFEVADDLILFHGEINLKRSNGMGILHEACLKGDVEIIQWTLDQKGIKYNLKDTNGETPLMKCSTNAPPEFIYNFMNIKEVDILGVDESGRNILHFCVLHHRVDFINYLGSKLGDMDQEDERRIPFKEMLMHSDIISKQTPLHLAVAYEKFTCVLSLTSLMVMLDCPFHKKDKKNMSAFDVSKEKYTFNVEKNDQIVQIYEYLLSMKKKKNIFK